MTKASPKLRAKKPKSALQKSLTVDYKNLFKALSKGLTHTVICKWEELGNDTVEALSALGINTEPGELAYVLIKRSMSKAIFDLISESLTQLTNAASKELDLDRVGEQLDYEISYRDIAFDGSFLKDPGSIPMVSDVQAMLLGWLNAHGVAGATAGAIAQRLPSYFVYSLNEEWRLNSKSYRSLLDSFDTPFSRAGDKELGWHAYASLLQRRVQESVFDEAFSLKQIFVPLNAYFMADAPHKGPSNDIGQSGKKRPRVVVSLAEELENWLQKPRAEDSIRVVSGGPGSGKSSFARIFAAEVSAKSVPRVLFIPLHLIDATKNLVEEVGRFVRDEGVLAKNPLDPDSPESNLLIIFDGLDELASQGRASAETARAFVREVERTVEKRNTQSVKLRVLLSGRELVVQENESEFRRERQILTVLPYFVGAPASNEKNQRQDRDEYVDPKGLLKVDLRQKWWKQYGVVSGKNYSGLPKDLGRKDLEEVTAQPLLNYLVACSYARERVDFRTDINLNTVYTDLVDAVYERGYEKRRRHEAIRHMAPSEFSRVLEEIGLASWHGDGRSTTISEIEKHCRESGVGKLLDVFADGAKVGISRLLAAFFFRQYGERKTGDPTFVFTHKSFGEFLTARRIVRAMERVVRELDTRADNPDGGWDEREALKHWAQICGPSPISSYLHVFLLNEVQLRTAAELRIWQTRLTDLFSYLLRQGMPVEQLLIGSFKEAMFQARNAEEGLLVALNACARVTETVSEVKWPTPTAFGEWFKRIQGQRQGAESVLAASCLSYLSLKGCCIHFLDLYEANLESSDLSQVKGYIPILERANLRRADLKGAFLQQANLQRANLYRASLAVYLNQNLKESSKISAEFQEAFACGKDW